MLILLLLLSLSSPILCRKDYTGYTYLLIFLKNGTDLTSINKLLDDNKVYVWRLPSTIKGSQTNVLIPPDLVDQAENILKSNNTEYEILTRNLQERIDKEYEENPPDNAADGYKRNIPLDVYHTFETINSHMDYLARFTWPFAKVETIGKTFEGNPLKLLKIGDPLPIGISGKKQAIWIDSGIHAREWITPATSLYIIHQLLDKRSSDPEVKKMMTTFDWYFWPVVNPDGYNYTWFNDRLWRKNLAPTLRNSSCEGTDLNRNFGVGFGDSTGSAGDPCTEYYHGHSAFSEKETKAYRDKIWKLQSNLKAVVSLHSYSQLLMSPYGYKTEYPPNHDDQIKALDIMKSAIEKKHGKKYTAGTIADVVYFTSGGSADWVYDEGHVEYSFSFELRDTGREGFLFPKSQIIETGEEMFAAFKAFANHLMKNI